MRHGSIWRRHSKLRWGIRGGSTADHHVIPRQWKDHVVVQRFAFDVDASHNLIVMPTETGNLSLRVRRNRMTHTDGHLKYNQYVGTMLDVIKTEDELYYLRDFLKSVCRYNNDIIPWV
jgi:hypothetical protein